MIESISELKMQPCPRPPKREVIVDILNELLVQHKKNLTILPNHKPDVDWLLKLISTLDPEHFIFGKDYMPNKNELLKKHYGQFVMADKNFFEGLPRVMTNPRKIPKRSFMKRVYTAQLRELQN